VDWGSNRWNIPDFYNHWNKLSSCCCNENHKMFHVRKPLVIAMRMLSCLNTRMSQNLVGIHNESCWIAWCMVEKGRVFRSDLNKVVNNSYPTNVHVVDNKCRWSIIHSSHSLSLTHRACEQSTTCDPDHVLWKPPVRMVKTGCLCHLPIASYVKKDETCLIICCLR